MVVRNDPTPLCTSYIMQRFSHLIMYGITHYVKKCLTSMLICYLILYSLHLYFWIRKFALLFAHIPTGMMPH